MDAIRVVPKKRHRSRKTAKQGPFDPTICTTSEATEEICTEEMPVNLEQNSPEVSTIEQFSFLAKKKQKKYLKKSKTFAVPVTKLHPTLMATPPAKSCLKLTSPMAKLQMNKEDTDVSFSEDNVYKSLTPDSHLKSDRSMKKNVKWLDDDSEKPLCDIRVFENNMRKCVRRAMFHSTI